MKHFFRRIKLRAHFKKEETHDEEKPKEEQIFTKRSQWTPPRAHHTVETFIQAVTRDIQDSKRNSLPKENLSKGEQKALSNFKKRNDIIITNADKGGAVVIIDTKSYIDEVNKQLNNNEFYKCITDNPTLWHNQIINNSIDNFINRQLIRQEVGEGLKINNPRTPRFYIFPKIHKKNNPGRPVVSSVNCHSSNISKYVDLHLNPVAQRLPSYVRDTTDFINKLSKIKNTTKDIFLI